MLGNWFCVVGYDIYYDGKWYILYVDLEDFVIGVLLVINDNEGVVDLVVVWCYFDVDLFGLYGFFGWVGFEFYGVGLVNSGFCCDLLVVDCVVVWLIECYVWWCVGDIVVMCLFLLVVSFVNLYDIVLFLVWVWCSLLKFFLLDLLYVLVVLIVDEDLLIKLVV